MMTRLFLGLFLLLAICSAKAAEIEKVTLPMTPDLQRADLYVQRLCVHPAALLVLCPGCNENGRDWIESGAWRTFAENHNLDLIGISYASDVPLLRRGRGYYYAGQGSGQLLLDGIARIYHQSLPLLLYGFSGGAHFVSGFEEWKPDRVIGWCAYSAEWWDVPRQNGHAAPGIVACGEDDRRLGASLVYFKQGRALRKRWLWLCAPKTGHSIYPPAEAFIRAFFDAILRDGSTEISSEWVDIDQNSKANTELENNEPSVTGWLPDANLFAQWREINTP
jgi:hypothetical protein